MRWILRLLARIMLYATIPLTYYLLNYCAPFTNTFIYDLPRPTRMSLPAETYDPATFGAPLQAGYAKRDITPPRFSWLSGYHPPHPGVFINDRLWVKSLALRDQNGQIVVIVSCDLLGLLPDEIRMIKELVKDQIPADRVFITCTHTHSGPDTMGLWGAIPLVFDGKSQRYLRFMRSEVAATIKESLANMEDSSLRFGSGELKGYVHGRFENPNDESVTVMQVLVGNRFPVTLINFACHADDFKTMRISADFPYYVYERMQQLTGGETMFVQGAIGGVQPSDGELDVYHARVMGENLADEVVFRIMKHPFVPKSADISVKRLSVKAPLENEYFELGVSSGVLPELRGNDGLVTAEVGLIKIGPAQILTVPGELFPKIWWRVKPVMGGEPNFIFGVTDGELGYILLPEDFASKRHNYHCSVSVGPTFGTLIDMALRCILEMKD